LQNGSKAEAYEPRTGIEKRGPWVYKRMANRPNKICEQVRDIRGIVAWGAHLDPSVAQADGGKFSFDDDLTDGWFPREQDGPCSRRIKIVISLASRMRMLDSIVCSIDLSLVEVSPSGGMGTEVYGGIEMPN
jgi:hypothetical protein